MWFLLNRENEKTPFFENDGEYLKKSIFSLNIILRESDNLEQFNATLN